MAKHCLSMLIIAKKSLHSWATSSTLCCSSRFGGIARGFPTSAKQARKSNHNWQGRKIGFFLPEKLIFSTGINKISTRKIGFFDQIPKIWGAMGFGISKDDVILAKNCLEFQGEGYSMTNILSDMGIHKSTAFNKTWKNGIATAQCNVGLSAKMIRVPVYI